jgi:hypothetical protein
MRAQRGEGKGREGSLHKEICFAFEIQGSEKIHICILN